MTLHALLEGRLALPAIAAPMFIVSQPEMVAAQCKAGIVGSFPSLNARPSGAFEEWLIKLRQELSEGDAPFAVNLIVHRTNTRLEEDLALCVKYQVPIVITSLGANPDVNAAVHSYGGIVLHDIINNEFAHKAVDRGADGLIAVAAGAGGHAGTISPFALVQEIREWFQGPLALSGAMANGRSIAAARALGADYAYIGSAFIATQEANAAAAYKQMVVESAAKDIVYSNLFTGVHGNYLIPSILKAGLDPNDLAQSDASKMQISELGKDTKAWRDIWGAGQGIGAVKEVVSVQALVARLSGEYKAALAGLANDPWR